RQGRRGAAAGVGLDRDRAGVIADVIASEAKQSMPPRVLNAGSNATKSPNDSTTLCPGGLAAMRMGAVMMRLSNLTLTSPAVTGLIMVTVLVLGAIVVRVVTLSEHGDVPTHIARDQGTLDQGTSNRSP